MILILSTDRDTSTADVMEYLLAWDIPVIRFNDNDILRYPFSITLDKKISFSTHINNNWVSSDDIKVVWFRKFGFFNLYEGYDDLEDNIGLNCLRSISMEYFKILNIIVPSLSKKDWLCHYSSTALNKLRVLEKAKEVGLLTPPSIITNFKDCLKTVKAMDGPLITKCTGDTLSINLTKTNYIQTMTTDITGRKMTLPSIFFPSLFQQKIQKKFEVRIFYLEGKFFSMAIFSQGNKNTETDFRNYDRLKPNRFVPFKLPGSIERKLDKLMKMLNLNTGSIDMIYSTTDEYIFLEVNPSGQFGMISGPCNYNLEKEIALVLKQKYLNHEPI